MSPISALTATTSVTTAVAATGTAGRYFGPKQLRAHPPSIPNQIPRISNNDAQLVPISALPPEFAAAYSFSHFNRLQSTCFADLYDSDVNLVISAPTASGKTVLMEIAICRLFRDATSRGGKKALYLAPLKSLCAEKAAEWTSRYAHCKLRCTEIVGGDASSALEETRSASQVFSQSQIVCTTPEKFVALAGGATLPYMATLLGSIGLLLIDECHMVGTNRGASLELVVSLIRANVSRVRIIAVSATVGNIGDIAEWLADCSSGAAKTLVFGEEYRPVPLTKVVLGYDCTGPYYQFQRNLDFKLSGIINTHGAGRSVLIFCPTRGAAQECARLLAQKIGQLTRQPMPVHLTSAFTNHLLNKCVPLGVAYHHAGLAANDRTRIEQLFINGAVQILCSTSTLGIGVNMPAYMVIVKGTKGYADNNYKEYAQSEVLQFIGRAGRPQFGPSGKAIILTEKTMVKSYQNLVSGGEILESSLGPELVRWILGGVYRQEFTSTGDVTKWMSRSFLAVRAKKNPLKYISSNDMQGVSSGDYCELGQKGVLNELNKGQWVRFKLKDRVQTIGDKALVLLQYGLNCRSLPASNHAPGLSHDMGRIVQIAQGLAMCVRECYVERGDVAGVSNSVTLCRELVAKCAEDSSALLQQIDGVGPRYAELLWGQGIKSISLLCDTGAREIERMLNRKPPFGTKVLAWAAALPRCSVDLTMYWLDACKIVFTIDLMCASKPSAHGEDKRGSVSSTTQFTLVVYTSDGVLLKFETIDLASSASFYQTQAGLCNPAPGTSVLVEVSPQKYGNNKLEFLIPRYDEHIPFDESNGEPTEGALEPLADPEQSYCSQDDHYSDYFDFGDCDSLLEELLANAETTAPPIPALVQDLANPHLTAATIDLTSSSP
ncbi:ATP-dependent DNA helicase MER3 [Coemansia aciculifera]|uniref:ATP-dependent DNA helicase MER3 n=1 Tax=Coemansia aciculifera TaxID=417176 RepID=A0A9W8M0T1_9FUNG|nr:ATP-dependent DNA helicase MER3 [Coemansia aciculifera]